MLIAGSQVIGPIIGASLFVFMSIEYIAMIDIVGALIAVTSLFFVKLPELKVVKEEKKHVMAEMKEGFSALKASKGLFKLSIIIALFQLACIPLGTLFPLMTKSHFGGDAINASIVETAFGVGMVVGSILLGSLGCKNKKVLVMLLAAIVFGATTMISGLLPASLFIVFAILSGIMGITASFCSGLYTALIQLKITPEKLGRVFSIINTIILVATPIGMLIAAPICDTFGVGVCFIIFGSLAAISGIIAFFIKDIMNMEKESQVDNIEQTVLE